MDARRAQEIAASPVMANVTYNGTRVYIQSVDAARDTARIFPLDQPEREQDVPVHMLEEH
ncbi:small acid-soluble spore protein H [Alicyclobacillus sp.]|uniref:small acid-soluble spore protein H n=1 Tax=Alicyclobacillus sp. TaxID=61169 RepID=UPI0025C085D1|nr:small acid-soluble spore protein H [Alicyclobacillus sp.]MCL6517072.1 small acid-soluble spore protein H [Alicyclobacillus sp.]